MIRQNHKKKLVCTIDCEASSAAKRKIELVKKRQVRQEGVLKLVRGVSCQTRI